jgi:hypothetical protein
MVRGKSNDMRCTPVGSRLGMALTRHACHLGMTLVLGAGTRRSSNSQACWTFRALRLLRASNKRRQEIIMRSGIFAAMSAASGSAASGRGRAGAIGDDRRSSAIGDDRRSAGHCLDHDQAEFGGRRWVASVS